MPSSSMTSHVSSISPFTSPAVETGVFAVPSVTTMRIGMVSASLLILDFSISTPFLIPAASGVVPPKSIFSMRYLPLSTLDVNGSRTSAPFPWQVIREIRSLF